MGGTVPVPPGHFHAPAQLEGSGAGGFRDH